MTALDLDSPEGNLRALVRTRASAEPVDTVTWFTGTVHAWDGPGGHRPLFGLEGYNIARAVEVDGGYDLLTREAVFYLDLATREVLETWHNPYTEQDVEVVHIWNSPVNQRFRLDGPRGPWHVPTTVIEGRVVFDLPIFLAYPSPLPTAEYPEHSQDDTYRGAELFQFFTNAADLARPDLASVPADVSWTRLGPWVPWMAMAQRPGTLLYQAHGAKLAGGYAALPDWIRERVERDGPEYLSAPLELDGQNETSWTYFKKLYDRRTAAAEAIAGSRQSP